MAQNGIRQIFYSDARSEQDTEAYVPTLEKRRQELSNVLNSALTTASLSEGQEKVLLGAFSELHDRGLATFKGALAKKVAP
jgi:hypothetical protein